MYDVPATKIFPLWRACEICVVVESSSSAPDSVSAGFLSNALLNLPSARTASASDFSVDLSYGTPMFGVSWIFWLCVHDFSELRARTVRFIPSGAAMSVLIFPG